MTPQIEFVFYRGRRENEAGRLRRHDGPLPRQGEFIVYEKQNYEVKQVVYDLRAEPPVIMVLCSLTFEPVRL